MTHFPTTYLLDLVAPPNVQSVTEADPGERTAVASSSWQLGDPAPERATCRGGDTSMNASELKRHDAPVSTKWGTGYHNENVPFSVMLSMSA